MKKVLNEDYNKMVERKGKSPFIKNVVLAFIVGGFICMLGQFVLNYCTGIGLDKETAGALSSVSLIFLSCLLTGLGLFDNIARHAGAGTLVPITGFANSIVSEAMEFKSEGYILGIGSKMFTIAGPVLVYGITVSTVCGVIYYLFGGR